MLPFGWSQLWDSGLELTMMMTRRRFIRKLRNPHSCYIGGVNGEDFLALSLLQRDTHAYHGLDFHVLSLTSLAGSCVSSDSFRTCQT